jgi:capsular exopolysaccharide synthesis family protein
MQLRGGSRRAQVILVTSAVGGEGKSTVAAQLARAFAWQKARVLLVEADFRSASTLGEAGSDMQGLSDELNGESAVGKGGSPSQGVRRDAATPNLAVLARGAVPEFPAELLGAERMQGLVEVWRREYDYIVMDGPAYLPVADAAVLAQQADAALLVLRERQTLREDALLSVDLLRRQMPEGAELGVVLNGVAQRKGGPAYARAS